MANFVATIDVGGTEELRDSFGSLIERAQPAQTITLYVPKLDDLKPIHNAVMDALQEPYLRDDGSYVFSDSVEMTDDKGNTTYTSMTHLNALRDIQNLFLKDLEDEDRTWVQMMMTQGQETQLALMAQRVLGMPALVKAKKVGLKSGN